MSASSDWTLHRSPREFPELRVTRAPIVWSQAPLSLRPPAHLVTEALQAKGTNLLALHSSLKQHSFQNQRLFNQNHLQPFKSSSFL